MKGEIFFYLNIFWRDIYKTSRLLLIYHHRVQKFVYIKFTIKPIELIVYWCRFSWFVSIHSILFFCSMIPLHMYDVDCLQNIWSLHQFNSSKSNREMKKKKILKTTTEREEKKYLWIYVKKTVLFTYMIFIEQITMCSFFFFVCSGYVFTR